jgi:ABC-type multidrug transport system fused ATPase/permease subunit
MGDRMAILIDHGSSTVKPARSLIVKNDREIIGLGKHEGLMTQPGHNAELSSTFFRHQSLDDNEAKSLLAEMGI